MVTKTSQAKPSSLRLLILTPVSEFSNVSSAVAVTPPPFADFLEVLTGTRPSQDITSFAGYTSHPPLHLKTRYYETNVSLWCDDLPPLGMDSTSSKPVSATGQESTTEKADPSPSDLEVPISSLGEWQDQMLSEPAGEVRQVIGGIVLLLPFITTSTSTSTVQQERQIPTWATYIESVSALRDTIEDGTTREVASIALLQDQTRNDPTSTSSTSQSTATETLLEKLEDECLSSRGIIGWDFVSWKAESLSPDAQSHSRSSSSSPDTIRNEHGEKTGIPRVHEVLEGVDWFASSSASFIDEDGDGFHLDELEDILAGTSLSKRSEDKNDTDLSVSSQPLLQRIPAKDTDTPTDSQEKKNETPPPSTQSQPPPDPFTDPSLPPPFTTSGTRTSTKAIKEDEIWSTLDSHPRSSSQPRAKTQKPPSSVQVDDFSAILERLISTREAASEMEGREKHEFAKREVARIMREMDMDTDVDVDINTD